MLRPGTGFRTHERRSKLRPYRIPILTRRLDCAVVAYLAELCWFLICALSAR